MARRLAWVCLAGLGFGPFADAGPPPPAQITAADESSDDLALAAACLGRGGRGRAVVQGGRGADAGESRPAGRGPAALVSAPRLGAAGPIAAGRAAPAAGRGPGRPRRPVPGRAA